MQSHQVKKCTQNPITIGNIAKSPFLDLALNLGRMDKMVKRQEDTFQVFGNERWYIWELSYNQRQTPTQWFNGRWDGGRKIPATGIAK